ncbi:hypothetical protein WK13_34370 [Burkholderia ubonensis]|uniref:hypothetical protein n=1 Tax=Burkholderia ubonensis TaxID=101571 RepID=UPI00075B9D49|nr:hypothetical protein [Burkholderia ubonensis]KVR21625.1 hypothetical protein WK13_34370 [Burkholderia ubonensis]
MALKFNVGGEQQQVAASVQDQAPVAKTKLHAKTYAVPEPISETQLQVDELVMIEAKLATEEMATMLKRQTELRKILAAKANDEFADSEAAVLKGTDGRTIRFSARKEVTEVTDRAAMIAALGEVFPQIASVSLTDLKKYLSAAELAKFTEKSAGSRSYAGFTE